MLMATYGAKKIVAQNELSLAQPGAGETARVDLSGQAGQFAVHPSSRPMADAPLWASNGGPGEIH